MTLLFASLFPLVAALDLSGAALPVQPAVVAPKPEIRQVLEQVKPVVAGPDLVRVRADDPIAPPEFAPEPEQSGPLVTTTDPAPLEVLSPPVPSVSEDVVLTETSRKLRETETARGGFIQTDAYGQTTTGDFYIRRPGRIRFEYAKPADYLVVSDGTTVAIEDRRLETMDRAPLSATPLKLFLNRNVDLVRDTEVIGVHSLPDAYLVVIQDKSSSGSDRVEGQLMLQIDRETYDLEGWIAMDGAGNETRISLIDVETNVKIPARMFVIEDPEDEERPR